MFEEFYRKYKPYNTAAPSEERVEAVAAAVLSHTEKEIVMSDKKIKRFTKKAVIIPVAAVLAAGAVTASAAGFGLFSRFSSYFSQTGSGAASNALSGSDIFEYEKLIELDDYNVRINGFLCDRFGFLVNYDVEYKADKYFEDGMLKQEFLSASPVHFFNGAKSGEGGMMQKVMQSGNTVSYVQGFTAADGYDKLPDGDYLMSLRVTFADTAELSAGLGGNLCEPLTLEPHVPAGNEISAAVNEKIQVGRKTAVLESIDAGTLSMRFVLRDGPAGSRPNCSVTLKDGTAIDLSGFSNIIGEKDGKEQILVQYGTVIDPNDIAEVRFANLAVTLDSGTVTGKTAEPVSDAESHAVPAAEANDGYEYPYADIMTPYSKITDTDDCTVRFAGALADDHDLIMYYSVTYKSGELIEKFVPEDGGLDAGAPLYFSAEAEYNGGGGSGSLSEVLHVCGSTVYYAGSVNTSGVFPRDGSGDYIIKGSFNDVFGRLAIPESESTFEFVCKAPGKQHVITPNAEVTLPSGGTAILVKAEIGALGARFGLDGAQVSDFEDGYKRLFAEVKLTTSDGRVHDVSAVRGGLETGGDLFTYTVEYGEYIDPADITEISFAGRTLTPC